MPSSMHIIKQENDDRLDFEVEIDKYGVLDLTIRDGNGTIRQIFTVTLNKAESDRMVHAITSAYQDAGL